MISAGYRAEKTGVAGPAGTDYYRIVSNGEAGQSADFSTCKNCRLCPANGLLPVRPRLHRHGYIVPAFQQAMVCAKGDSELRPHMLPIPFAVNIVLYSHPRRHPLAWSVPPPPDPFGLGANEDWTRSLGSMLQLVPDLAPEATFTLEQQFGHTAGARPQGWEGNDDADNWLRHRFVTVIYGRDPLKELHGDMDSDMLAMLSARTPIVTGGSSLASIIHASRMAATGLPPEPQTLWNIWQKVAEEDNNLELYHAGIVTTMG